VCVFPCVEVCPTVLSNFPPEIPPPSREPLPRHLAAPHTSLVVLWELCGELCGGLRFSALKSTSPAPPPGVTAPPALGRAHVHVTVRSFSSTTSMFDGVGAIAVCCMAKTHACMAAAAGAAGGESPLKLVCFCCMLY
jgi:hypothetical protein